MAPRNRESASSDESSDDSVQHAIIRKGKFEDEDDESDVLDSWDAAEDSDAQRAKAQKAAETRGKAEAEAASNKKSRSQRAEAHKLAHRQAKDDEDTSSSEDEDPATSRARARQREQDADLKHAEDLIGNIGVNQRSSARSVVVTDPSNPESAVDLFSLPIFKPKSKDDFASLREVLVPLLVTNARKAHYNTFVQEFCKQLVRELPSDQIKKVASGLTTLSNEKMKEEKAAEKGGKKTKAAKTKTSLVAGRDASSKADTTVYGDLDDDDFM